MEVSVFFSSQHPGDQLKIQLQIFLKLLTSFKYLDLFSCVLDALSPRVKTSKKFFILILFPKISIVMFNLGSKSKRKRKNCPKAQLQSATSKKCQKMTRIKLQIVSKIYLAFLLSLLHLCVVRSIFLFCGLFSPKKSLISGRSFKVLCSPIP